MEYPTAYLLGIGGLAILLIALLSSGYYLAKLRDGWIAMPTIALACAVWAIMDVGNFLFVAPLLASLLGPIAIRFTVGWGKRYLASPSKRGLSHDFGQMSKLVSSSD